MQFRTISAAAKVVKPGARVLIHSGTYRESVKVETSGTAQNPIRFEAAPAAHVVINGADLVLDWQKESVSGIGINTTDNIFSTSWSHRFITWSTTGTHPGDDEHAVIGRAEQVFINGYPLQQVLHKERLSRGTFWVDTQNGRLWAWASNNAALGGQSGSKPRIEASTRSVLWECSGDFVQLRGVRFRYAANQAQQAAAQFRGKSNVIEDCVFERVNSIGAGFYGEDQIVRRCTFQDNGQMGWSATRAHRLLFSGGLTRNNNTKNFGRGWEAGGDKIVFTRGAVLEKSTFIANRGVGIWFDIGNEETTIRNCLIADNEDAGIFYEISYSLHAHDNVIVGNGLDMTGGSWGANGGIALSSSPNCLIERNLLIGNKEGFQFREQNRRTPLIDAPKDAPEVWVWNHDQVIRNNVLAYNQDAQAWGWFDVNDERHWPAALQEKKPETASAAADIAKAYTAKDEDGAPRGLTLEKLNLRFENNLLAASENQGLWNWGTTWKRHKTYTSLADVQRELKLETGSRVAPFEFRDYLNRDFRVPANSPALKMNCYPKGEVPGVQLGVLR
ncbi:MAG: hypothetical protein JWN98_1594 [Abditibacteriota bacterium]|nr:hypothetical protein [Abditibacteriota bacterium]